MKVRDAWNEHLPVAPLETSKAVLLEVKTVLDALKVPFFLIFGTCLGAMREKNFIDIDPDIDLGILHRELVPKLNALRAAFDVLGYESCYLSTPYPYNRMIRLEKHGVRVDLVGWDHCRGEYFHPVEPDGKSHVFPRAMFDNLTQIDFLGAKFFVPTPVEKFLVELYGENWGVKDPNYTFRTATCLRLNYWEEVARKELGL